MGSLTSSSELHQSKCHQCASLQEQCLVQQTWCPCECDDCHMREHSQGSCTQCQHQQYRNTTRHHTGDFVHKDSGHPKHRLTNRTCRLETSYTCYKWHYSSLSSYSRDDCNFLYSLFLPRLALVKHGLQCRDNSRELYKYLLHFKSHVLITLFVD